MVIKRIGWGYCGYNGTINHKLDSVDYGKTYKQGDSIGVYIDMNRGELTFLLNGNFNK
jgi:hypothetical protein